jgi:hypothetical protein
MSDHTKQLEMGKSTNLIADMTIGGAKPEEIVRAVRHSMVVIDAQKHDLNYKQSEKDNRIQELKDKYQGGGGAATIISRAKSEQRIGVRKRNWKPDPETGEVIPDNHFVNSLTVPGLFLGKGDSVGKA